MARSGEPQMRRTGRGRGEVWGAGLVMAGGSPWGSQAGPETLQGGSLAPPPRFTSPQPRRKGWRWRLLGGRKEVWGWLAWGLRGAGSGTCEGQVGPPVWGGRREKRKEWRRKGGQKRKEKREEEEKGKKRKKKKQKKGKEAAGPSPRLRARLRHSPRARRVAPRRRIPVRVTPPPSPHPQAPVAVSNSETRRFVPSPATRPGFTGAGEARGQEMEAGRRASGETRGRSFRSCGRSTCPCVYVNGSPGRAAFSPASARPGHTRALKPLRVRFGGTLAWEKKAALDPRRLPGSRERGWGCTTHFEADQRLLGLW